MARQRLSTASGSIGSTSSAAPSSVPSSSAASTAATSTMPPRAVLTSTLPRLHQRQRRGVDDVAGFVVQRHMQRQHIRLLKQFLPADPLDKAGKVAIDDVGVAGDHPRETVAADAACACRCGPARVCPASCRARRSCGPALRSSTFRCACRGRTGQVAKQRQRHRQRMGCDFADAVVRRVGDPDTMARRVGIDGVEPCAVAANESDLRQCRNTPSATGAYCTSSPSHPRQPRSHRLRSGTAPRPTQRPRAKVSRSSAISGKS